MSLLVGYLILMTGLPAFIVLEWSHWAMLLAIMQAAKNPAHAGWGQVEIGADIFRGRAGRLHLQGSRFDCSSNPEGYLWCSWLYLQHDALIFAPGVSIPRTIRTVPVVHLGGCFQISDKQC